MECPKRGMCPLPCACVLILFRGEQDFLRSRTGFVLFYLTHYTPFLASDCVSQTTVKRQMLVGKIVGGDNCWWFWRVSKYTLCMGELYVFGSVLVCNCVLFLMCLWVLCIVIHNIETTMHYGGKEGYITCFYKLCVFKGALVPFLLSNYELVVRMW